MDDVTRCARYVWAAPATLLGIAAMTLSGTLVPGRVSIVDGVIEAHGAALRWALRRLTPLGDGASAMTFGHVVLGVDAEALERTRAHERVHVRQYERWGPFFIPAYLLASLWALGRGEHFYFDNRFEREAFRLDAEP
jgi:hypothetical protein